MEATAKQDEPTLDDLLDHFAKAARQQGMAEAWGVGLKEEGRLARALDAAQSAVEQHVAGLVPAEREALNQELRSVERRGSNPRAAQSDWDRGWNAALDRIGVWLYRRTAGLSWSRSTPSEGPDQ